MVAVAACQDSWAQTLFCLSATGELDVLDARVRGSVAVTFTCPSPGNVYTGLASLPTKRCAPAVVAASADGVLCTVDVRTRHMLTQLQLRHGDRPVPIHCIAGLDPVSWKRQGSSGLMREPRSIFVQQLRS